MIAQSPWFNPKAKETSVRFLPHPDNRPNGGAAVEEKTCGEGEEYLQNGNFDILVEKLDGLKEGLTKLEKRFDESANDLFDRVRELEKVTVDLPAMRERQRLSELEQREMKVRLLWLVTAGSFVLSTVVALGTSLIVHWIKSSAPTP